MKNDFSICSITPFEARQWVKYKHYAKRIPPMKYAFGLFDNLKLVGVCTFSPPPKAMNNGESVFDGLDVPTFELNRLVLNEGLKKNTASFFVARCLKLLPTYCCVVSYADATFGHIGYIYQALNFIYTGLNEVHERSWYFKGKEVHSRTLSNYGLTGAKEKEEAGYTKGEYTKKHRYIYFLGSKTQVKKMKSQLKYKTFPYPKGQSVKYDASFETSIQTRLF